MRPTRSVKKMRPSGAKSNAHGARRPVATTWTPTFAARPPPPPSHGKRSVFSRCWTPNGPLTQLRKPSVKAVKLSALRHTIKPLAVCCSASPLAAKAWLSRQSPATVGMASCSVLKPRMNWQSAAAAEAGARRPISSDSSGRNLFIPIRRQACGDVSAIPRPRPARGRDRCCRGIRPGTPRAPTAAASR